MGRYVVAIAPTAEPLTVDEAKEHLRVTHAEEDAKIARAITSARIHVERTLCRALMPQTWRLNLDEFSDEDILLPGGVVSAVDSIDYTDTDGASQSIGSFQSDLDSEPARLRPAYLETWPATRPSLNAVRITYQVGHADADSVPAEIKDAMLLMIGDIFENRTLQQGQTEHAERGFAENKAFNRLLFKYRPFQ